MPEPGYRSGDLTDFELELLRRQGLVSMPQQPQQEGGGLLGTVMDSLSARDPEGGWRVPPALQLAAKTAGNPIGAAADVLPGMLSGVAEDYGDMAKQWNDRVTGRVPVMDPTTGRVTPESATLAGRMAVEVGGVGTGANMARRAATGAKGMDNAVGIFAGQTAANADLAALARAEVLERQGVDPRKIWSETGWARFPDGEWRWETDDSKLKLLSRDEMKANVSDMGDKAKELTSWAGKKKREAKRQPDFFPGLLDQDIDRAYKQSDQIKQELGDPYGPKAFHDRPTNINKFSDKSKSIPERLGGQRLKHAVTPNEFNDAYKDVADNLKLSTNVSQNIMGRSTLGALLPTEGMVILNSRLQGLNDRQLETLIHELQHVAQEKEGFATGFSSKEVWTTDNPLIVEARNQELLREMGVASIDDYKEVTKSLNPASRNWTEADWQEDYKGAVQDALLAGENLPDKVKRDIAFNIYERILGEAEARLAGDRANMGPLERRASYPVDELGKDVGVTADKLIPYKDDKYGLQLSEGGLLGGARLREENLGPRNKKRSTIKEPERVAFPGIYDRPDEIARKAAERVAPEDPALKEVFGVTRDELYEMGQGRVGNVEAQLPKNATSGKNANAERIMTPKNTQRMLDTLSEAGKYPGLQRGMDAWYVMDPLYQEYVRLYGPEKAYDEFMRFNTFTGMSSPGSDVLTEINRGTAANYLHRNDRFDDFERYGGKAGNGPSDMADIKGHPYHSTSHAGPMRRYIKSGDLSDMTTTKVPLYIQSNTNPVAYQSNRPVGDAHFVRGIGLSDARTAAGYGESIKNTELATIAPWWKKKIADELGITPVEAQARSWGTFGHATGVDTPIGAPKLELLAIRIKEAAKRYNISIEEARDLVLKGGGYASVGGGLLGVTAMDGSEERDRLY